MPRFRWRHLSITASVQAVSIAVPVGVPTGSISGGALGLTDVFGWQALLGISEHPDQGIGLHEVAHPSPEFAPAPLETSLSRELGYWGMPENLWQPEPRGAERASQRGMSADFTSPGVGREPPVISLPTEISALGTLPPNGIVASSLRLPDWYEFPGLANI